MKKLLTLAIWAILVIPANAQLIRSSPNYTGRSAPLTLPVTQFDEYNVTLTANTPIVLSVPKNHPGTQEFRINTCQDSFGGWTPTFTTPGDTTIVNRIGSKLTTLTASACDTENWTFRSLTNQLVLESISYNTLSSAAIDLSAYVGAVNIFNNLFDGTSQIVNTNVNNVLNPKAFGASGVGTSITCTSNGTTTLTGCSNLSTWQSGTNVYATLVAAGTSNSIATPTAPVATDVCIGSCTGSSHTYQYYAVVCGNVSDGNTCSAPSPISNTITSTYLFPGKTAGGPNLHNIHLVLADDGGGWTRIYKQVDGGTLLILDETQNATYDDYGQPTWDYSHLNVDVSGTLPVAAMPATYETQVTGISGSSMTVAVAPTQTGTITIYHNDGPAFRATLAAIAALGGGTMQIPPGTFNVNIDDPIPTSCAVCFQTVMRLLPANSNTTITGAGQDSTIIRTTSALKYKYSGTVDTIFEINGANSAAQYAINLTVIPLVATVPAGSFSASVSDASSFNVNDEVFIRTGMNDPFAGNSQPDAEYDRVGAVDYVNNILYFQWPVRRTYQQRYWLNGTDHTAIPATTWAQGIYVVNNAVLCGANCPGAVSTLFVATASTLGGATGASEPNWAASCSTLSSTCTDGQVTWTNRGTAAAQSAIFGIANAQAYTVRNVEIKDLQLLAGQGSGSLGGIRGYLENQVDGFRMSGVLAKMSDAGTGFSHDSLFSHNHFTFERSGGGSDNFATASGTSDTRFVDGIIDGQQPWALQVNEGSIGVLFNNIQFSSPFPEYPAMAASIGGSYTNDLTVTNNTFCGNAGAGAIGISSSALASQSVHFSHNTLTCPFTSAIPDGVATGNRCGNIQIGDPDGSDAIGNTYIPTGAFTDCAFSGVVGGGYSNIGHRLAPRVLSGTITYSQGAMTPLLMGTLSQNDELSSCKIQIVSAFNAGTSSNISIGYSGAPTAYVPVTQFNSSGVTLLSLTTTLISTLPPAANNNLTAYYTSTGTAPTAGIATVTCSVNDGVGPGTPPINVLNVNQSAQIGFSGSGNLSPNPFENIHSDYTPTPENFHLGWDGASVFSLITNSVPSENTDGEWKEDFNTSAGVLNWSYKPHSGAFSVISSISSIGTFQVASLGQLSGQHDVAGTITITSATSNAASFTNSHLQAPICTLTPAADPTSCGTYWATANTSQITANVHSSCTLTFNYICVDNPN